MLIQEHSFGIIGIFINNDFSIHRITPSGTIEVKHIKKTMSILRQQTI